MPGAIFEDNQSTITVINNGYSPQLRHLAKHYRVSLGLVHEYCSDDEVELKHVESAKQKGDLMTKGLGKGKHEAAMQLVGLFPCVLFADGLLQLLGLDDLESDDSRVLS